MKGQTFSESTEHQLSHFAARGGEILSFDPATEGPFLEHLERHLSPDVRLEPSHADLRYMHVRKDGWECYYLTNEGEGPITGRMSVRSTGYAQWWDPLTGRSDPAGVLDHGEDTMCLPLHLERREGRVLAIDPGRAPKLLKPEERRRQMGQPVDCSDGRVLRHPETEEILAEHLADWATLEKMADFSGTLAYEKALDASPKMVDRGTWTLDLGEVHDFAEVFCNGISCGVRLWAPFRFMLPIKPGANVLHVSVTNSMANRMEGAALPSGMLGPVRFEIS
ncbi:MAG: glycosylhydrolase-like jelly roll fold domain-containing protein [Candidatus Latescibacterota bacterium]